MKKNSFHYIFPLFALLLTPFIGFCQQSINVASSSTTINGATFDYSIGEMTLVSTERNATLIVTQGLLQPTDSRKGNQAQPANTNIPLSDLIKVYPNPTENILNIESYENANAVISYQLFDATGKVILSEKAVWQTGSNKITLDLKSYASGSYYLMIRKPNPDGILNNFSYKIQKTN
ncbi:MAG: T9SS type A sorting domain-containing protein [Bacteroidetes bacterium]|nr:T9SS type A sorting domain-containing protein [Bacteroidota bacterium]MBP6315634.1 T9SS type A sorting domain-containing protein [Chitinophagaceae bacterium]